MPEIQIVDPLQRPQWDEWLLSGPDPCFFHSSAWARVLNDTYKYTPVYFTIMNGASRRTLVPAMEINSLLTPRRGVSLPFTDYSAAIIGDEISASDIWDFIVAYGRKRKWNTFELRAPLPHLKPEFSSGVYFRHVLPLSCDADSYFASLNKSTRYSVRHAVREGITVKVSNTLSSLKAFHALNCLTRKRHGIPPQPFRFFESLHKHVLSRDLGSLFIASRNRRPIAASLYVHFGSLAIWKYGASDIHYSALGANSLIIWEAVRFYCARRFRSICFGRTDTDNEGLRYFKASWGTKQEMLHYYTYNIRDQSFSGNSSPVGPVYRSICRRLPVPLLRIIGYMLYQHVG